MLAFVTMILPTPNTYFIFGKDKYVCVLKSYCSAYISEKKPHFYIGKWIQYENFRFRQPDKIYARTFPIFQIGNFILFEKL